MALHSFERLPVELWEHILSFVIDGALLLTPNPFEFEGASFNLAEQWICPMHEVDEHKNLYWGMKDQPAMRAYRHLRATLRLVCSSWKRYTDSSTIENRIVRLRVPNDTEEGVSIDHLVGARRIEAVDPMQNPVVPIEGVVNEAVEKRRRFNARVIIDDGGTFSMQILRNHAQRFPFLSALHINLSTPGSVDDYKLDGIITQLPLKYLSIVLDRRLSLPLNDFRLNLVSLNLSSGSLQGLSFGSWRLPKLRHLRLDGLREGTHPARLAKYLWRFGSELTHLSLTSDDRWARWHVHVPLSLSTIWKHCPKLEHLEAPISIMRVQGEDPPTTWPLTHFVNTSKVYLGLYICEGLGPFGDVIGLCTQIHLLCSRFRYLKIVTDTFTWTDTLAAVYAPMPETEKEKLLPTSQTTEVTKERAANTTIVLARKLSTIGIRYEDKNGLIYNEATAFVSY